MKAAASLLRDRAYPLYLAAKLPGLMRQDRAATQARREAGLPEALRPGAFERRSDVVFILGSGRSINDITDAQWAEMTASDTIGFNNWMVHPFVPTFYVRELRSSATANIAVKACLTAREAAYRDVPFLLKDVRARHRDGNLTVQDFRTAGFGDRLVSTAQVYPPADTERDLRAFLRLWRRGASRWPVPTYRASLSFLILLAYRMGYREIVLCGIDLNVPTYFWEDDGFDGDSFGLPRNATRTTAHRTTDPDLGLPIQTVIKAIQEEVLAPAGIALTLISDRSALVDFLPVRAGNAA